MDPAARLKAVMRAVFVFTASAMRLNVLASTPTSSREPTLTRRS